MTRGTEVVVRPVDPMTRLAMSEVVRTTPELRSRVTRFVGRVLDEAEEMLETGTLPTRLALVRSVLPATMRELKEEHRDESIDELRALVAALHADIRDQIETVDVESWEAEEVIEVDTPIASVHADA